MPSLRRHIEKCSFHKVKNKHSALQKIVLKTNVKNNLNINKAPKNICSN